MSEIENRSDGSCSTCCTMIDGDGVVAGLRLLCRKCAGIELDATRACLASAEARAEELLLLYGEEHERAERLAAYVRASEQLRHAEIMLGNSEDHTSQSRTWSYAVMEADCKLIAARGEFQPGDLGEL